MSKDILPSTDVLYDLGGPSDASTPGGSITITSPESLIISAEDIEFVKARIKADQIDGLREFVQKLMEEERIAVAHEDGKLWPYKAPEITEKPEDDVGVYDDLKELKPTIEPSVAETFDKELKGLPSEHNSEGL